MFNYYQNIFLILKIFDHNISYTADINGILLKRRLFSSLIKCYLFV